MSYLEERKRERGKERKRERETEREKEREREEKKGKTWKRVFINDKWRKRKYGSDS